MTIYDLLSNHPLHDNFNAPEGKGHKFLVKYMLSEQQRVFEYTILKQFKHNILIRNMKLLCDEYPEDEIKRAIALAVLICEHPFSVKVVKGQLEWLQALQKSCPIK